MVTAFTIYGIIVLCVLIYIIIIDAKRGWKSFIESQALEKEYIQMQKKYFKSLWEQADRNRKLPQNIKCEICGKRLSQHGMAIFCPDAHEQTFLNYKYQSKS